MHFICMQANSNMHLAFTKKKKSIWQSELYYMHKMYIGNCNYVKQQYDQACILDLN